MNAFSFGTQVRRKGQRDVFLVTGSELVKRGDGSTIERVHLAAFKWGSQEYAHNLERA